MGRGVATEHRTEERRRSAEQRYLDGPWGGPPNFREELEAQLIFHDLMAGASKEQYQLARLRLQGLSLAEAAQSQGIGVKRARRLLKDLHSNYLLSYSEQERGINFHDYG